MGEPSEEIQLPPETEGEATYHSIQDNVKDTDLRRNDVSSIQDDDNNNNQEEHCDTHKTTELENLILSDNSNSRLPVQDLSDTEIDIDELFETYEVYTFEEFAARHFQGGATPSHCKEKLEQPLLPYKSDRDRQVALAIWTVLLRFMGDLPGTSTDGQTISKGRAPVMSWITKNLKSPNPNMISVSPKQESVPTQEEKQRTLSKGSFGLLARRLKGKVTGINHRTTTSFSDEKEEEITEEDWIPYEDLLDTNMEKIHFIIGNAILSPQLRDEIYCQLCKQLTDNPDKNSLKRGWILLALCVGCFTPSQLFLESLETFVMDGPATYAPYCEEQLRRTCTNGTRHQPPSWLELQAIKLRKPLMLPVTFMDGNTKTLLVDPATTARELCYNLAQTVGLKDRFGFSLYASIFGKVSSMGSSKNHVMDMISICEQLSKEKGGQERNASWRLFYRKEIFSPWHDPRKDRVATNLIYQQVIRGIKFGEYQCASDQDLEMVAAQQYYVEYGDDMVLERLQSLLSCYIPTAKLQARAMNHWIQGIVAAHRKSKFTREKHPASKVKEDIVSLSRSKWPLLFSRFYEAFKFSGPPLPKNDVIIAVNWTGVYVVDENETMMLRWMFPEITAVSCSRASRRHGQCFSVATWKGEEYTFTSPHAQDVHDLVLSLLRGVRRREGQTDQADYATLPVKVNTKWKVHKDLEKDGVQILKGRAGRFLPGDKQSDEQFLDLHWDGQEESEA